MTAAGYAEDRYPGMFHGFFRMTRYELDYEAIGASLDCSAESARAHVFQVLRKTRAWGLR